MASIRYFPLDDTSSPPEVTTSVPELPVIRKPRDRYKSAVCQIGAIEIVLGIILVVLSFASVIAAIVYFSGQEFSGGSQTLKVNELPYPRFTMMFLVVGVLCGVLLIVVGLLAICTEKKPSACMFKINMLFSILSAICMGVLVIISTVLAAWLYEILQDGVLVLHLVHALSAFVGFLLCIVHSGYCCAGTCCHFNQAHVPMVPALAHSTPVLQQQTELQIGTHTSSVATYTHPGLR